MGNKLGNILKNTGHGLKKYEITNITSSWFGRTLYRIRALRSFTTIDGEQIRKGDLGGSVESEDSLSQEGNCWIGDNAWVYDYAQVKDNALVYGGAVVCGDAKISDNAQVHSNAVVFGKAVICGNAEICRMARINYDVNSGKIYR